MCCYSPPAATLHPPHSTQPAHFIFNFISIAQPSLNQNLSEALFRNYQYFKFFTCQCPVAVIGPQVVALHQGEAVVQVPRRLLRGLDPALLHPGRRPVGLVPAHMPSRRLPAGVKQAIPRAIHLQCDVLAQLTLKYNHIGLNH